VAWTIGATRPTLTRESEREDSPVAYNNPTPEQSTTMTAVEREREAGKILALLREESDLDRKITRDARQFLNRMWQEEELWGKVVVSPEQLWWLRDLKSKFD
jgi:hypothetical protein